MQEGQSRSACIWKITTISRGTEMKFNFKLCGSVQFSILPTNFAICNKGENNDTNRTHKAFAEELFR